MHRGQKLGANQEHELMGKEEVKRIRDFLGRRIVEGTQELKGCQDFCKILEEQMFHLGEETEAAEAKADHAVASSVCREIRHEVEEDSATLKRYTSILNRKAIDARHDGCKSDANSTRKLRSSSKVEFQNRNILRSMLDLLDIQIQDKARTILRLSGSTAVPSTLDRYTIFKDGLPSDWGSAVEASMPTVGSPGTIVRLSCEHRRAAWFEYVRGQIKLKLASEIAELEGFLEAREGKPPELMADAQPPSIRVDLQGARRAKPTALANVVNPGI